MVVREFLGEHGEGRSGEGCLLVLVCGDVRNRWVVYLEELLNVKDVREPDIVAVGIGARIP